MSTTLPEDQLIELLLHLKKTTPDQARAILNSQPQISYALIALMVRMDAVDVDMMTKHLASYGVPTGPLTQPPASSSLSAAPSTAPTQPSTYRNPDPHNPYSTTPLSSGQTHPGIYPHGNQPQAATTSATVPPYQQSSATNLSSTAPGPYQTHQPQGHTQYSGGQSGHGPHDGGYSRPNSQGPSGPQTGFTPQNGGLPDAFAHFPEEQKALMMRVITMTPEELRRLPPVERAGMMQLRATLGLPT